MKLQEYQAKELLAKHGVIVPAGGIADTPEEVKRIATELGGKVVVKAQVLMGGRGKAGGIGLFDNAESAAEFSKNLFGKRLISIQNPDGLIVEKLLVVEKINIDKEFYLAILLDRAAQSNIVMISAKGGMDIEEVAINDPDAIVNLPINPKWGLCDFEIREALKKAKIDPIAHSQMITMIKLLTKAYEDADANLIEINPCALTTDGKLVAADAKVTIDPNALYRHPEIQQTPEASAENAIEAEASNRGIAYVHLGGNVGVIGNGAGLVMLTIDEIARAGQRAANFLDVGGGAQAERVKSCVELVMMNTNVKALLINIFGGITRGDEVASGIVSALKELKLNIPIVVRIEGTNAEKAREILANAGLIPVETVQEAAATASNLIMTS